MLVTILMVINTMCCVCIIIYCTGKGNLDRSVTASGPLDVVNRAVESMKYICRSMDGCLSGYVDRVTVIVNDEGFSGKGGPLKDTQTMMITVM